MCLFVCLGCAGNEAQIDKCVRLARTIYIRCIYGNSGRDFNSYTVIYGVYIRSWPILHVCGDMN